VIPQVNNVATKASRIGLIPFKDSINVSILFKICCFRHFP
jgi:hypothetical protein